MAELDALLADLAGAQPEEKKEAAATDSLDDLMADLQGSSQPAAEPAGAKKESNVSDLDALMADLGAPAPKKEEPAPASGGMSDLDALMNDLGAPPAKKEEPKNADPASDLDSLMADLQQGSSAPAKEEPKAAPANDLDALMADLGAPPPKKEEPKKAEPAVNDLDALMADLGAPPAKKEEPKPAAGGGGAADLDALMADLGGSPAPAKNEPAPSGGAADLDALMADLSAAPGQSGGSGGGGGGGGGAADLDSLMQSLQSPAPAANKQAGANDLDSVMAALQNSPAAGPQPTQSAGAHSLDNILTNLTTDMNKMDVNTEYKGTCSGCNKPIVGQVVTALGKSWHVEHFACGKCHVPLGTASFFEKDGMPFCEKCYHAEFSPRCAYCNGPIMDRCINALGKMWHPDHFFCAHCGKSFETCGFMEKDGKAYCAEDYYAMFAPKCGRNDCGKAITGETVTALDKNWHKECFNCVQCSKDFKGGNFFPVEGQPVCENCYHASRGSLCGGCKKPITGRCVTAMGQKFHPEHFICAFCMKQLSKGSFKEQNEKAYCLGCHVKLYG